MGTPVQDGWMKPPKTQQTAKSKLQNFLDRLARRQPDSKSATLHSSSQQFTPPPTGAGSPFTRTISLTGSYSLPPTPHPENSNGRFPVSGELDNVEYSVAVDLLGLGKFHVGLALCCGVVFLAAGLENNLNAYILSSVYCDLKLSSSQLGLLNAVFLAGGISSNFLWGVVADLFGRHKVVLYGMLVDGIITVFASLSQSFDMLLALRFFNGFVVGGPASLVLAYMGEFFPNKVRAKVICYVGIFWTLSWVIMPAMAWMVIPIQWSFHKQSFEFNSWRLLVALTSLPSLISFALFLLFPESPRFLLVQGKGTLATRVLARIYSVNSGKDAAYYPVNSLQDQSGSEANTGTNPKSIWYPVCILIKQTQLLFAAPTIKITFLTCFLFFSNMFGYYGLGLWLPEMFNRLTSHLEMVPGAQVSLCSAGVHQNLPVNETLTESICDPTDIDTKVFVNSFIMGIVGLFGNVISGVLADQLQRRTLPVILMCLSAICIIIIYFTTNMTLNLVVASTFQLTVGTANLVYNSLIVDMFPPNISGMGVCLGILAGRLGGLVSNLMFGYLLDISCSVPVILVAAVLFTGSVMSFFIPNEPYTETKPSVASSPEKMKHEGIILT
ncbi:synaptic vesicle glycoprotein 2C-like [Homalodisca vitripennis]|uniref:synaptic vesicle glycoprotein 2C-like n=1 Tax=Homalodisca vitripennis TaxID=197043 RepID=UPI001EEC2A59|nr:synaptic vesicle glycoprotein 2C-like [Homalodisca vitripennis]